MEAVLDGDMVLEGDGAFVVMCWRTVVFDVITDTRPNSNEEIEQGLN
jgi:hypothetical protein